MILEADVTLTDLALAAECAAFAVILLRRGGTVSRLCALVFVALGASSLLGALWHGMFSAGDTAAGRYVWFGTMACLALAATATLHLAAALVPDGPWPRRIRTWAKVQLVGQLVVSAGVTDAFAVGALGLVPASVLLAVICARVYARSGNCRALCGAGGLVLAVLAGLVIVADISVPPNLSAIALYHLVQAVAFWMVFLSVPALASQPK
ncbi:DUF6962 family protein [Salipiger mucosus]|uniref:Uncharacterized protein n=1 Tax=Salipiger mucosus DSM 16094 TaxID=1123237 RepID=S9QAA9_9RHOB|nr:hypothetical protein [Salipiger mucosus]EPX78311.1 hypothetical protein Salmuc_03927 [Salipiger mucosus DSM 16094]